MEKAINPAPMGLDSVLEWTNQTAKDILEG